MNRVIISLLKGSNMDKLTLLKENFSFDKLINLCSTKDLSREFNLQVGYNFNSYNSLLKSIEKMGIETISLDDLDYPEILRSVYDPPFLLYLRGNREAINDKLVSVVGTRKPSLRGLLAAYKLGLDLGRRDVGVVSGLAVGVDTASHRGNIETGGKTVAVLGSGIDSIYPKSNKGLAGDIIGKGGVIVSEFPPGEAPKKFNFPKRNRIIAGLTGKVVIVQAPLKSGSLITGDFTLDNGGEIYVHSCGVNDIRFLGSDKLFKEGAKKIDTAGPILSDLGIEPDIKELDSSDYTGEQLLRMELDREVVKYKGCYFWK